MFEFGLFEKKLSESKNPQVVFFNFHIKKDNVPLFLQDSRVGVRQQNMQEQRLPEGTLLFGPQKGLSLVLILLLLEGKRYRLVDAILKTKKDKVGGEHHFCCFLFSRDENNLKMQSATYKAFCAFCTEFKWTTSLYENPCHDGENISLNFSLKGGKKILRRAM